MGLYAVGQVSSGIHGAERLGGNSLAAEALAMGRRTGESAAKRAMKVSAPRIDWDCIEEERRRIFTPSERKEGMQAFARKKQIRHMMYDKVGIIRHEEGLKEAISRILRLSKECSNRLYVADKHTRYNSELVRAIEVLFMLDYAEVIARAALFRTENRGCHYREDYAERDNKNWCVETGIQLRKGEIDVYKKPVEFAYLKPGEVGYPEDWLL